MKKWICPVCGFEVESETKPPVCVVCGYAEMIEEGAKPEKQHDKKDKKKK